MKNHRFSWKNADYSIFSEDVEIIINEIKNQRCIIENYLKKHPEFISTIKPLKILPEASEIITTFS